MGQDTAITILLADVISVVTIFLIRTAAIAALANDSHTSVSYPQLSWGWFLSFIYFWCSLCSFCRQTDRQTHPRWDTIAYLFRLHNWKSTPLIAISRVRGKKRVLICVCVAKTECGDSVETVEDVIRYSASTVDKVPNTVKITFCLLMTVIKTSLKVDILHTHHLYICLHWQQTASQLDNNSL